MVNIWWDNDRIESTVTHAFVCQHLLPQEIDRLGRQVGFGDGLTNDTYWDWIETKVKRIFLILVDLGVPDQIFGLIDDSWSDTDLPLDLENISRLALATAKDERLERRFYQRQFLYMVRPLKKSANTIYGDNEMVPIDHVDKKTPIVPNAVDRVTIGNDHDVVYWRQRMPLDVQGGLLSSQFQETVDNMRSIENDHIVSYWGSYVYQGVGYVLYTPASEFSLKSFFTSRPVSYKNLSKPLRKELVMNWIMCLADTICFLHSHQRAHSYIKPSSIHFTKNNKIFLSDTSNMGPNSMNKGADRSASFDREWYDYAAPEQWFKPSGPNAGPSRQPSFLSSSPESFSISTPRTECHNTAPSLHTHNNLQLSPQAADIFSFGCIILELLSFLLKKQHKFASHRAAKHKTAGRGGAVLDSSFHKNLNQVESWMTDLAKEANKKPLYKDGNHIYRGFIPLLRIVACMLATNPQDRPSAQEVQQRIYEIVTEQCNIAEPHCVHRYDFDFGFGQAHAHSDTMSVCTRQISAPGYVTRSSGRHNRTSSSGGMSTYSGSTGSASLLDKDRELIVNIDTMRSLRSRDHGSSVPNSPVIWEGLQVTPSPVEPSYRGGMF
ncbi:hypothetical protein Cpir12675_005867 [Ceratocystis pirilliformis]|uniref:Protein kinase domain-containing protein n=1 Tax=Ceratocystis pirilliformis TaxID=259994 RepID=A0ABR3YLJ0_9PEZI